MRKNVKIIALLMAVILCLSTFSNFVINVTAQGTNTDQLLTSIISGKIDPSQNIPALDMYSVPEILGYSEAVAKNHILRLYEDEGNDLNKLVFLNIDGSKTMYTYNFPVKYVDANGDIQDITLEIADGTNENESFKTAANSTTTTFSAQITDGISLSGNNTDITLIPLLNENALDSQTLTVNTDTAENAVSNATRIDKKTISYKYDDKTTIEYSLTYTGFKEDIVVNAYTGQTEYDFILYTNGYTLTDDNGAYYLTDDNGHIKATIGDIIIFTADNRNNTFGDITATPIVENEKYLITILVDEDFLSDEKTTYPIRIDPTVEINYNSAGSGAIGDVTVYSNDSSDGNWSNLYIGLKQTYGISRVLMKFPGLDLDSLGSNITITNATVSLRDLMCESTPLDIYCYVYSGPNWTESSANWGNTFGTSSNCISTFLSMNTFSYSNGTEQNEVHRYNFDITKAVQGWVNGNYSQDNGILFKTTSTHENGTTYTYRSVGSYNGTAYKPALSITYTSNDWQLIPNGTYYLNNKECGNYLKYNSASSIVGASGLLSSLGTTIRWELQEVSDGYVIRAANNPTIYLGVPTTVSSNAIEVVSVNNTEIPERCLWTLYVASCGGCLIKNNYNSKYLYTYGNTLNTSSSVGTSGTNTYFSRAWRIVSISEYGNTSSYTSRELSSFSVGKMRVDVGQTLSPTIATTPSDSLWTAVNDFNYTYTNSGYFSVDPVTKKFTGTSRCPAQTVTATHKITGLTKTFTVTVNSNLSSFLSKLSVLYDAAYAYTGGNQSQALEATFKFIRVQAYNDAMWQGIAGEIDTDFMSHIQNNYPSVYNYFICDSNHMQNNDYIIMIPDTSTTGYIDVLHLAATLNRYYYTGETTLVGIPTLGLVEEEVDDLAGWAGDLQSLIDDYFEAEHDHTTEPAVYNTFYPMIGSNNYHCSFTDIITDMDACNLRLIISNSTITNGSQLSSIISNYYNERNGNVSRKRFTTWISTSTQEELREKVTVYCNDHSPILGIKWPILNHLSIYDYHQTAFTDAFVNYLLYQRSLEQT